MLSENLVFIGKVVEAAGIESNGRVPSCCEKVRDSPVNIDDGARLEVWRNGGRKAGTRTKTRHVCSVLSRQE